MGGTPADSTCWTTIEKAAAGSADERETFARQYLPAVKAYLLARWRGSPLVQDTDDAVQDVFVECFRSALKRPEREQTKSFRAYLYGVVRNVARRFEERQVRHRKKNGSLPDGMLAADEVSLSVAFDRAWAVSMLRKARDRQIERAPVAGEGAASRVELLRLRHEEDLPIREIAVLWQRESAWLHHEYAKARDEFRTALLEVVAFEHPGTPAEVERECARLVSFFS